jgi:hypothetical protein
VAFEHNWNGPRSFASPRQLRLRSGYHSNLVSWNYLLNFCLGRTLGWRPPFRPRQKRAKALEAMAEKNPVPTRSPDGKSVSFAHNGIYRIEAYLGRSHLDMKPEREKFENFAKGKGRAMHRSGSMPYSSHRS